MGFRLIFIVLLSFAINISLCGTSPPPARDLYCHQHEILGYHAVLPKSRAEPCSREHHPTFIAASCLDGFVPNGNVTRAECCLDKMIKTMAHWEHFQYGNHCIKAAAKATSQAPTLNTTQAPTLNTLTPTQGPTTLATTIQPWLTVSTSGWHPVTPRNITWMKPNCLLFFASEIVLSYEWKKKPYKFNSTSMRKEMQSVNPQMSCSNSNHVVYGGWFNKTHNITFSITFRQSSDSWYASHIEHNDSDSDVRIKFGYDSMYFKSPLGHAFHCDQSVHKSTSGSANITFRNITVQGYGVNGKKFSSSITECAGSSSAVSTWTTELTVLIVCISVGSVIVLVIIAYIASRCLRSEYDFLK